MPTETVNCPKCGRGFPDNSEKHRNREKYSPCCKVVYKTAGLHLSLNLDWLKEKLLAVQGKEHTRDIQLRGRAKHNVVLQCKENETEVTEEKIEKEFRRLKKEDDMERAQRKRLARR